MKINVKLLDKLNLMPADRIIVPKSDIRWVQHHAIYLGKDDNGIHWIAENKIGNGVQIVTANIFFRDVIEISGIESFKGNDLDRKKAVMQAMNLKGSNYDLFFFNCEHYANLIQNKKSISHQMKTVTTIGILGLFILFFIFIITQKKII